MSPTAEQTEERSQHDEKDGSKRSLRRFSIEVALESTIFALDST